MAYLGVQFVDLSLSAGLLAGSAEGCTPYISVEDAFTTSALRRTGNIPPEFAEFNNYDPEVNPLLADQGLCHALHCAPREIAQGLTW